MFFRSISKEFEPALLASLASATLTKRSASALIESTYGYCRRRPQLWKLQKYSGARLWSIVTEHENGYTFLHNYTTVLLIPLYQITYSLLYLQRHWSFHVFRFFYIHNGVDQVWKDKRKATRERSWKTSQTLDHRTDTQQSRRKWSDTEPCL